METLCFWETSWFQPCFLLLLENVICCSPLYKLRSCFSFWKHVISRFGWLYMCFNLFMFYYRVKLDSSKKQLYKLQSLCSRTLYASKGAWKWREITNTNGHVCCESKEECLHNAKALRKVPFTKKNSFSFMDQFKEYFKCLVGRSVCPLSILSLDFVHPGISNKSNFNLKVYGRAWRKARDGRDVVIM